MTVSDLQVYYAWTLSFITNLKDGSVEKIASWVESGEFENETDGENEDDDEQADLHQKSMKEGKLQCLGNPT